MFCSVALLMKARLVDFGEKGLQAGVGYKNRRSVRKVLTRDSLLKAETITILRICTSDRAEPRWLHKNHSGFSRLV